MIINWNTDGNKTYSFLAGAQSLVGSWVAERAALILIERAFQSNITKGKTFFSVTNKSPTFNSFETKGKTFFSKLVK